MCRGNLADKRKLKPVIARHECAAAISAVRRKRKQIFPTDCALCPPPSAIVGRGEQRCNPYHKISFRYNRDGCITPIDALNAPKLNDKPPPEYLLRRRCFAPYRRNYDRFNAYSAINSPMVNVVLATFA